MAPFGSFGLGLSFLLLFVFFALCAEVFYLLWWKKKKVSDPEIEDENADKSKEFLHCLTYPITDVQTLQDPEIDESEDVMLKTLDEESVEAELKRLHNLSGPARFLFTIKEETKEDLESLDGRSRGDKSRKSSRTRSLSDGLMMEAPFPSPQMRFSSFSSLESFKKGFNPLSDSPPPKLKFLRDAEEKFYRRLAEQAEKNTATNRTVDSECSVGSNHKPNARGDEGMIIASSQVQPLNSPPS